MKKKNIWKTFNKSSKLKVEDLLKEPIRKNLMADLTKMNDLANSINTASKIDNMIKIDTISQWKELVLRLLPKNISNENQLLVEKNINNILFNWRE